MKYRIGAWAIAGFLFAGIWLLILFYTNLLSERLPARLADHLFPLFTLTDPGLIVVIVSSARVTPSHHANIMLLAAAVAANGAMYALMGFIVETLRRKLSASRTVIKVRGQAEAVNVGRPTKFVISNWTPYGARPSLPESIPGRITPWIAPPQFEGRTVEVIGYMGHWWRKDYFIGRSVRIPQMGYLVRGINVRRLCTIGALTLLTAYLLFSGPYLDQYLSKYMQ